MSRFKIICSGYLFICRSNSILLSRRFNTGFEDGKYSVPSGHLEEGETIKQCAIREAAEEIGITIHPDQLSLVHIMHRRNEDERIDYFFHVNAWEGDIKNLEPDKCDDLDWFPFDQLPENTIPYIRSAIEQFRNKILYSELGWETK